MDNKAYIDSICDSWIYPVLLQTPNPKVSYLHGFPVYVASYERNGLINTLRWRETHLSESKASNITRWIENFLYTEKYWYVREYVFPIDNIPLWNKSGQSEIKDFVCVDYFIPTLRLVIEVDMDDHHDKILDRARDKFLKAEYGVSDVIRIGSESELVPKIRDAISGYSRNQEPINFSVNNANTWISEYWEQLWFIVEYERRYGMPIGPDPMFGGKHKITYSEIYRVMFGLRPGYFKKPGPWEKITNKYGALVDSDERKFTSKLIYVFEVLLGQRLSILESKDTSNP